MKKIYRSKGVLWFLSSVFVSVLFVTVSAYAATTISTNINTGGTLTVTDTSTLTGDLAVDTDTLYVDVSTDRTGVGTTTPSAMFSVGEGAGTVTGDAYFTGGLTVGGAAAINSAEGTIILSGTSTDPVAVEGLIYYDNSAKLLKIYDGSQWAPIATSTGGNGFTESGWRLQLTNLNSYMTFGTTTQRGLSMLTLTASSSASIPLTIVAAEDAQTANLFQILDTDWTEVFAVDALGHASSTGIWDFAGAVNANGAVTLGDSTGRDQLTIYAFATMGTTTQNGLSMLTLSASSSTAIPLTITTAEDSQTANLFQILGTTQTELFAIDANGHASSTGAWTLGGTLGVGSTTPLGDLAIEQTRGLSAFTIGSSTLNSYLMDIDANGDLTYDGTDLVIDRSASYVGIGTSTPRSALSIGTAAASTTISTGKLCLTTQLNNGAMLYMWPCSGGDGCAAGQAWATSTTDSCE